MTRIRIAVVGLVLVLGACGDDDAATTTTTIATTATAVADQATTLAPGTPAACGPLAEVVRLSNEFALRLNGVMTDIYTAAATGEDLDPATEIELLDDFRVAFADATGLIDELIGHYDDAAALAEPELAAAIVAVRDGTVILMPILSAAFENADTFAELSAQFDTALTDPAVAEASMAAGLAALSIDEFSIPECGFKVSNS